MGVSMVFFHTLSLTSSLASLLAPSSNKSFAVGVRPLREAISLYLTPLDGFSRNEKNKRSSQGCAMLLRAHVKCSNRDTKRLWCFLFFFTLALLSNGYVYGSLSLSYFLSYLVLRLLVSPFFQQEIHSCGVTVPRGMNECSVAPLLIEGEAHHRERMRRRSRE